MFDSLFHADWSCDPKKKWITRAERFGKSWSVYAPQLVKGSAELLGLIWERQRNGRTALLGFDFPIGLPMAVGKQLNFDGFDEALSQFGFGEWRNFFEVADKPEDISLMRPFYPNTSRGGRSHVHLTTALGVTSINDLRRECERKTENRPPACPVFWTLGGNQVGKGAIDGWTNLIRPALAVGASLWPFDGSLDELSKSATCVLCETYPREAYGHIGLAFRPGQSKRRQDHRRMAALPVIEWAARRNVILMPPAEQQIFDGFGSSRTGEDAFDAFIGLLSMIDVVNGGRPDRSRFTSKDVSRWEGWILGQ